MEYNKKSLSLDEMRAKRTVAEVVYKKFTECSRFFDSYAFCFFEGEDGKYYNPRIEKYFKNNFITMVAGNKKEVLRVMKKIQSSDLYKNVCTMFFVDRDYDKPQEQNFDLFETPCYSIENLYAQESSLCKILQAEFGLNIFDSDYNKSIEIYRLRLLEFNQIILRFNAIVKYQHKFKPTVVCQFSGIKTNRLANISVNKVLKSNSYDKQINQLMANLDISSEELYEIEKDLSAEERPELTFRGKNQLDFMVSMIKIFKDLNANGGFFSGKLSRVYITISDNRLSELSQYAVTPPELTTFLENHYSEMKFGRQKSEN